MRSVTVSFASCSVLRRQQTLADIVRAINKIGNTLEQQLPACLDTKTKQIQAKYPHTETKQMSQSASAWAHVAYV